MGQNCSMKRIASPLLALAAGATALLGSHPALAHGTAGGGLLGGVSHPLLGLDHLLMLVAVGAAASLITTQLLLWALAGAAIGAWIGSSGLSLGGAEVLAALAISAVALITLLATRLSPHLRGAQLVQLSGSVVAAGVAIHALLHGLEAPQDSSTLQWWSGALLSSVLVCGGTCLLLKRLPLQWTRISALLLLLLGGGLALMPLGVFGGAGA